MPFVEPLAAFFNVDEFAVSATWNGAATVAGIFDEAYAEAVAGVAEGSTPVFTCAAADVPGVAHGDTLAIGARTFTVRGVQPDGTGVVLLILEAP